MTWLNASTVECLGAHARICVTVNGISILIINDDGRLFAVENRCSHAGKPLEKGMIENGVIRCPYHGAEFRLDSGEPLSTPAYRDIRAFPVRRHGNKIEVKL